jgi:hypothetical protein
MNTLKKYSIVTASLIIFLNLLFVGCQDEYSDSIEEQPFLSLNSDVNFDQLSEQEIYTVAQALKRIDIYKEGGLYHITQTSGAREWYWGNRDVQPCCSSGSLLLKEKEKRVNISRC